MKKKIFLFILVILLVIAIYYYFRISHIHNVLLINPKYIHTKIDGIIPSYKLPDSKQGIKFTYSFWLYLKNIPENGIWNAKYIFPKYILYRYGTPNVVYFTKKNKLRIYMTFKNKFSDIVKDYIEIDELTFQQWNNIVITLDNKDFDVYLNGELYGSIILKNIPLIFKRNMHIGEKHNNFNGYLSYLEYFNDKLSIDSIRDLYNERKNTIPTDMLSYSNEFYIAYNK